LTQGAYATRARASTALVTKIPDNLPFEAAASIPLAYCTAYHSLMELGRLLPGESVLIHAAAGAVGQAAITLAQLNGAEVFATVGSAEKKELLMKEYGLSEERIFYSRNNSFGAAIRQATGGQGVDVLLNSLTGEALRESWACLNKYGRFIDIGKRDITHKSRIEMAHVDNNASFISVDLFALLADRPKVVERLMAKVAELLKDNKAVAAKPLNIFPISKAEDALKALQTERSPGKQVIVPGAEDSVMATPSLKKTNLLKQDATYILIGGTGGLGRSMARWMVSNGGKHIVLVSRNASATGAVKELIDELEPAGANIVVKKCDVTDGSAVDDLVKNGLKDLPPIRGVVHGTMVLADVLYERMEYDCWSRVVEGKVQGGWNFHNALTGVPLDFFVAISSAAGAVGSRGQAAYAAANCFLNALVQHRLAQGLAASTLDLTMVSDAGYLTMDADKMAETMRNLGSDSICEAEVLALLGAAISGRLGSCNNHTITGMRITPSMQPFWTDDAKFKHLRLAMEAAAAADASLNAAAVSYNAALKAAKTLADAEAVVCRGLVEKISGVLMMAPEELDVTRSLSHYPLDSLVAIEIRNFITREFEANLQVLELLSSGSIQTLSAAVCSKSKLCAY
jgi:NADPH:quinone reductase-like Zn-dependent oxidoreductase